MHNYRLKNGVRYDLILLNLDSLHLLYCGVFMWLHIYWLVFLCGLFFPFCS